MSYEREVSGTYSQWPGWHAFQNAFADPWGERQTYWSEIHQLSDFVARTQSILQGGTAKVDLAVFKGQRAYGWGYTRLLEDGYNYDIISNPHLKLPTVTVQNGVLCPDGPGYRALLVVEQEMLPIDSATILLSLAKDGLPILFVGKLPHLANGANSDDAAAAKLVNAMLELPNVYHVADLDSVPALLRSIHILPLCGYHQPGLEPVCRQDDSVACYFVYNGKDPVTTALTLQGRGKPVQLNPYTGTAIPMAYTQGDGCVTVQAAIGTRDAVLIALVPDADAPTEKTYDAPLVLSVFDTTVESWGPDPDAQIPTQSKKITVSFGDQPLCPWDALPASEEMLQQLGVDSMEHVSGRGFYRCTFTLPDCNGAELHVETGECMVVGGTINGQPLPAVNQRTGCVDLAGLVHAGENILEITVATTLINRLKIAHPLFDGKGGMPAPPAPDQAADGEAPAMGNPEDDDYELPSAPMDMPTPHSGATHYGLLTAEIRPYR